MKTFKTYAEAVQDIKCKEGSFAVFQIPRDNEGLFTWVKI